MDALELKYVVERDNFAQAGEASGALKKTLKSLGFPPDLVRRVAIAMYEAEINMVIHAYGGEITATVTPERVMMALVLVTWNTWPLRLVRVPPVMVKELVPLSASPDMDW